MPWQGIKTFVAGAWEFSDANSYVRDAQSSLRKYQRFGTQHFPESFVGSYDALGLTIVSTHYALLEGGSDEATKMTVLLWLQYTGAVAAYTPTSFNVTLVDSHGNGFSSNHGYPAGVSTYVANFQDQFIMGTSLVQAAGVNPGFAIKLDTVPSLTSGYFAGGSIVMVRPVV